MTEMLFRADPYLTRAEGRVQAHAPGGGLVMDATPFYPRGGGQPGDSGALEWDGGRVRIADTVKGQGDDIVLLPEAGADLPPAGAAVVQHLDWERRHGHMRVHTALHLLSVAVPLPVSGGAIGPERGRLDFDMPDPVDREALDDMLNALIARDLPVGETWISDGELAANPGLVKTMSVAAPTGQGRVRLVWIGDGDARIDLQPCGGTHVARTGEIGRVRIGKIQKKGRQNRRIYLELVDGKD